MAIYRTIYLHDLGYLVYRHVFDENRCGITAGVLAHRIAAFVSEDDARDYCAYRNRLIDERGTDELRSNVPANHSQNDG